jgi:hypothetical protein
VTDTIYDERWVVNFDPPRRRDTRSCRRKIAHLERMKEASEAKGSQFDQAALELAVNVLKFWVDHDPWWEKDAEGNWSLTDYAIRRQHDYAKRQAEIASA